MKEQRENQHQAEADRRPNIEAVAANAQQLKEQTTTLSIQADRAHKDQAPKIKEYADLVEDLIRQREELMPKIAELVEQAGILQREKGLPSADEYARSSELEKVLDAIYDLEEQAQLVKESIDTLANNPDIKKELDRRTQKEADWDEALRAEKELVAETEDTVQQIAQSVIELAKRQSQESQDHHAIDNNLWDGRGNLNRRITDVIRDSKGKLTQEFQHQLWLKHEGKGVRQNEPPETTAAFLERLTKLKEEQSGWGNKKLRNLIDSILSLTELDVLKDAEQASEKKTETDWSPDLTEIEIQYRTSVTDAQERYGDIFQKANRGYELEQLGHRIWSVINHARNREAEDIFLSIKGRVDKELFRNNE